jgi:hypothetical protein
LLSLLVLALPATQAAEDAGKNPLKMITGKFAEISREEMDLEEVSFEPGAPAVVLFEGLHRYYAKPATGAAVTRIIYQRRVKILDENGIKGHGDYSHTFGRGVQDLMVRARTILPDGTEIDAADNINRDTGATRQKIISIAFPQVQVGAILELIIQYNVESVSGPVSWEVQNRIPTLQSLFIYSPPEDLRYATLGTLMRRAESAPLLVESSRGRSLIWHLKDQKAIPVEPNQPPFINLAKTVYVLPGAWRGSGVNLEFATDWKSWNKESSEEWADWIRTGRSACKRLARSAVEGIENPLDKAEALRQELRTRTRARYYSDRPMRRSPDETLNESSGSSADIAGTMVAMLRAVGLDADLVAIRHRDDGYMPMAFPIPLLFNDMIVRLQLDDRTLYFSPVVELPVWKLPGFAHGVTAMPLDIKSDMAVRLPELTAEDDKATREATLEIGSTGELLVSSVHTYEGVLAESWRALLRDETGDKKKEHVQDRLRLWMPGARLEALEIENLLDVDKSLVLRCEFVVEGYISIAGNRWFINPNLFSRVPAEEWSAEIRETTIDLGNAYERLDVVTLRLPSGVAEITLPQLAEFQGSGAGFYKSSISRQGDTLIARRHQMITAYSFPPVQYPFLKGWFGDMAEQDDQPIVLRMQ